MPRRLVLVLVWLVGTASAALLATFAVSFLGERITNPDIKPLSREQVTRELAASEQTATSAADLLDAPSSSSTPPEADGRGDDDADGRDGPERDGLPDAPDDDRAGAGPGASGSSGATTTSTPGGRGPSATTTVTVDDNAGRAQPSGGGGPAPAPSGSSSGPGPGIQSGSSGPGPAPSPTIAPPTTTSVSRTFQTVGGTVQATCTGSTITASATPAPGWNLDRSSKTSGSEIDIRFRQGSSGSTEIRVRADCQGDVPTQHA